MRQWQEIIKPWPVLKNHELYKVRVFSIEKLDEEDQIKVTFEFLEKQMEGRHVDVRLSRPIRPDGLTADYFKACGIEVAPNTKITPTETIGKTLNVRFERIADDRYRAVHFEAIPQEVTNDPVEY